MYRGTANGRIQKLKKNSLNGVDIQRCVELRMGGTSLSGRNRQIFGEIIGNRWAGDT
jgi:hypothetical protein